MQDQETSRQLVVMRHAKAEQEGRTDFERPLSPRGRQDAFQAGQWLAARGFSAESALVSAAARTAATWTSLASGGGWAVPPELSHPLYSAGPESALDLLRGADPGVRRLVVVGHNPTMAYLAQMLDDGHGDRSATAELISRGYPTAALTVFEYDGDWADLDTARLTAFHVGRAD